MPPSSQTSTITTCLSGREHIRFYTRANRKSATSAFLPAIAHLLRLIIFFSDFKIALRMLAYRAYLRSFCSNYDMSAVAALPHLHAAFLKYLARLNVVKQSAVSLLMALLNRSYAAELLCQSVEAF